MGFKEDITEETHPAYGLLSFHRITGHPGKLYGSHLDSHHGFIQMRLARGRLQREGTKDWHFGSNRGEFVEVNMSPAQFAELITTMNMGSGTPCTVVRFNGEAVEKIPEDHVPEQVNIRNSFEKEIRKKTQKLRANEARLEEILSKKGGLTKKDRNEIRELYGRMLLHFEANAGFAVQCFSEATEKVVVEAKANVDNFVTGALTKLGLDALKDKFTSNTVLKSLIGKNEEAVVDVLPESVDAE